MTNVHPIKIELNDANFLQRLRSALLVQSYLLTTHAKVRMVERKISTSQVLQCLGKGKIDEPAHLTVQGDWKATVGYQTGGDYVQVSAAISKNEKGDLIVIVTVIL